MLARKQDNLAVAENLHRPERLVVNKPEPVSAMPKVEKPKAKQPAPHYDFVGIAG